MKTFVLISIAGCMFVLFSTDVAAQGGFVCGNPKDKGCIPQYDDFKPYDLGFLTGRAELGTGTRHESSEFYAVILESVSAPSTKSRMGCAFISETKRIAAQKLFSTNKVFASRNACVGTIVLYEGVDNNYNFFAVYAGSTEDGANKILEKAKKRYPSANIRKMQVVLDFADE
jgi:hypothetical protein